MRLSLSPSLTSPDNGSPKHLSRREVLALLAGGLAAAGVPSVSLASGVASPSLPKATLTAFVDVLIPEDEFSPSASQLKVDKLLLERAMADAGLRNWLAEGLKWLDDQTPKGFVVLEEGGKVHLVNTLATDPAGSFHRNFFEIARYLVMASYYSQPASWAGLAVNRPPQPEGYMDFAS